MSIFGLVRHGQTDLNRQNLFQGATDAPLNETGRQQAHEALANAPQGDWAGIYSSDLIRAVETAQIIAADHQLDYLGALPRLRELNFGYAEGKPAAQMLKEYPLRDFPGAEPTNVGINRGLNQLAELAHDFPAQNFLIASHGSLIRLMCSTLMGKHFSAFRNARLTRFEVIGEEWKILQVDGEELAEPFVRKIPQPIDLEINPDFITPLSLD